MQGQWKWTYPRPPLWQIQPEFEPMILWSLVWRLNQLCHSGHISSNYTYFTCNYQKCDTTKKCITHTLYIQYIHVHVHPKWYIPVFYPITGDAPHLWMEPGNWCFSYSHNLLFCWHCCRKPSLHKTLLWPSVQSCWCCDRSATCISTYDM